MSRFCISGDGLCVRGARPRSLLGRIHAPDLRGARRGPSVNASGAAGCSPGELRASRQARQSRL
jgi:hypothetical protein